MQKEKQMAKRFTDTTKWQDDWFLNLDAEGKLFWFYLCDNCDHAGVWRVSKKAAELMLGFELNLDEFLKAAGERLKKLEGDYWHLTKFCAFQYGKLDERNSAHKGALKILRARGLEGGSTEAIGGLDPSKDKDMVKDKEEGNKERMKEYTNIFYAAYIGKYDSEPQPPKSAFINLARLIKSGITKDMFRARLEAYFKAAWPPQKDLQGLLTHWDKFATPLAVERKLAI